MIHRNICPICGTENPEGTQFCLTCQADLSKLPDEMFPSDPDEPKTITAKSVDPAQTGSDDLDLDSPVPRWLAERFKNKNDQPKNFDINSYTDAIFTYPSAQRQPTAAKTVNTSRVQRKEPIFQPALEELIDAPLLETAEEILKSFPDDKEELIDFSVEKPARKWDDVPERVPASTAPKKSSSVSLVQQLPSWLQQDMPLIEDDTADDTAKSALDEDPALINSVSPTKLINAAEVLNDGPAAQNDENETLIIPEVQEEFTPASGSLLSDLMNEINGNSESLTPREQEERQSETIFYSGNHPDAVQEEPLEENFTEIINPTNDASGTAEMLDRILRQVGYQVEGEAQAVEETLTQAEQAVDAALKVSADDPVSGPEPEKKDTPEIESDPALIPDEDDGEVVDGETKPLIDAPLIELDPTDPKSAAEDKMAERYDDPDDLDIPWDLFASADMTVPQFPEDPEYRTFSRSGIPETDGGSTYQQRIVSSVLGKIIHAENFVPLREKPNAREVSIPARLFLFLLAIVGVMLILFTPITDHWEPPAVSITEDSREFYDFAEKADGNVMVVMDYTAAYSSELDNAAEGLMKTLENKADQVYLAVLNPAAMPKAQEMLKKHPDSVAFAGWWPAGAVSIRARMASGDIPEQVWLLTSESGSVRDWAEQLSVSNGTHSLHVMGSGQLEPLLAPYLRSGMVTSAISRDYDLVRYGENAHSADRTQFAVWYLMLLVPVAFISGWLGKFFKTTPAYERINMIPEESAQQPVPGIETEMETHDERRL